METIIPSPLTIRAHDNTSRKVMVTFKAPCKIVPLETIVEFHVLDITPNYNLLLGRAWLHPIRLIPSSLHQKMKIPWKGGIAVVLGDGEILALVYELEEGGSELQMSGFEFVNMLDYGLKDEGLGFLEGCNGIKKDLGIVNGNFVKEGGDFHFYGFLEL